MLDAGIDVFSTVNVQHLESLNDRVAELTGVRVRETFPDHVLSSADELVLVDLTPEALIGRLREGKVYPAERVPAALNNFFRIENLAALREVALRQTAEDVESKRAISVAEVLGTRDELLADEAPTALAERILALITPRPRSQRLVRRAWRSAQRLGAELDLLYVQPPGYAPAWRGARAARGNAPPGLGSRRDAGRGGGRRLGGNRRPGGDRARYDLRADRPAEAADRLAPPGLDAARPADAQAARGRRAHRGRPLAPPRRGRMSPRRRILFPFLGSTLSNATLESALRTARAQGATLVPAYLAMVPNHLSLESALPLRESEAAVPLLELIDQRATSAGVAVDSRIGRGRTPRQALSELMEAERYDTLVVAAQTGESDGFSAADVAWLLENAPGEVLVLRPGADSESAG